MKRKNIQLYILLITFSCLVALVAIQIIWIIRSAKMQEAQFNHSVNMAMNKIVDNLARDRQICSEVTNCLREGTSGSCYLMMKNRTEWANIGTMIREDLKYYGITLGFEFDIIEKKDSTNSPVPKNTYFTGNLEEVLNQSGYQLQIKFPGKKDFIKAQIGYIFISSIILLVLLSLSFVLIYRYYRREKKLSAQIVDLINNMTHEFRTPLTNIALANNMLLKYDEISSNEKLSSLSKVIGNEQKVLKERVDQLLSMSLAETEKTVEYAELNLGNVVSQVINSFELQIRSKNCKIDFVKPEKDVILKANQDSLQLVIGNLLDNALKYNNDVPEINIRLTENTDRIILSVSDNGIGIPREHLENIFTKYFRVPTGDIHNNNGFGLGLYYVKSTLKKMGASITVKNNRDKGITVKIEFPKI